MVKIKDAGYDTYLTGEPSHSRFYEAKESGLNVLFGGHYATETVGLKALAGKLHREFDIPTAFLDFPTGL